MGIEISCIQTLTTCFKLRRARAVHYAVHVVSHFPDRQVPISHLTPSISHGEGHAEHPHDASSVQCPAAHLHDACDGARPWCRDAVSWPGCVRPAQRAGVGAGTCAGLLHAGAGAASTYDAAAGMCACAFVCVRACVGVAGQVCCVPGLLGDVTLGCERLLLFGALRVWSPRAVVASRAVAMASACPWAGTDRGE